MRVATKSGFFTEEQGRTALAEGVLTRQEAAVRQAFTALEEFAHAGRIGGYGVATWSGLTFGAFSVP
ncbi:hypothetical protein [Streptomyces sp. NPDC004629]|uniref:hypothetical protein n=1 Tax=Streptomyces sp. NPDC004629 TaxID=3364705 RepID=UPI0036755E1C